ncbi:hypothetical protein MNAN1_000687 [Malassezia nana]|uniref:Rab-GAP TBC domain-containing protein n=1 Tax=Malassezia nana TaxID=180528 RepID=A0AAF0EJ73_9BASI|nr:hypothetical protein MNAN1_000687 [Malassezia nana]
MKKWEAAVLGIEAPSAAEADAFWCFSLLVGQFREVFDWGEVDQDDLHLYQTSYADMPHFGPNTGIALALRQCSTELRYYDETLWLHLCKHSLDPQTSNYTLRWMACLWAADVPVHVVWQLWDVLLTERFVSSQTHANASVDALVDICCAMFLVIRDQLLDIPSNLQINLQTSAKSSDVFLHTLQLLRAYPLSNSRPIISLALQVREHRLLRERNPTLMGTQRRDMRAESEMQTRNTNLQARLAATVSRSLATPPKRIMSGDAPQGPETPSTQAPAGIKAMGHETCMSYVSDSPGGQSASNLGETPSPGGSGSSRLDARLLWRKCTDAIQESDTAAHVSKASTNLAAKSLHWHSKLPKKPEPQKQNIRDPNVPDLPIPAVLDSPRDRQAYSPTIQPPSAPLYIHPASTDLGSRSMSSDEADTSSSLVLPSLENMSSATNLASTQDYLSMWLSSPDPQNSSNITRSSGRQRSRPSPPPKDDVFVAPTSTHM